MAGLGRRTHYRKHLTDSVMYDLPEPDETHRIAVVQSCRGGNMFDVIVASPRDTFDERDGAGEKKEKIDADENDVNNSPEPRRSLPSHDGAEDEGSGRTPKLQINRSPQLAFLPTKFRKLIWIKRNDFVIVECGDDKDDDQNTQQSGSNSESGGGFRYVITNILYKDQVKHIKSKGLWPVSDPLFQDEARESQDENQLDEEYLQEGESGQYEENGIVFEDPYADDLMVNTNRIATLRVDDDSSDSNDDD